jgi:hypothetical protein
MNAICNVRLDANFSVPRTERRMAPSKATTGCFRGTTTVTDTTVIGGNTTVPGRISPARSIHHLAKAQRPSKTTHTILCSSGLRL